VIQEEKYFLTSPVAQAVGSISRIPYKLTEGENLSSRTLKDFFDGESNNHRAKIWIVRMELEVRLNHVRSDYYISPAT
jgi:hypothetical protein